jgi:hypothetical protein
MPDHRVGCVGRFEGRGPLQASHNQPERRPYDTVGEIFGQALNRRARNSSFVKEGGISPDDHGNGTTPFFKPISIERFRYGVDMIV